MPEPPASGLPSRGRFRDLNLATNYDSTGDPLGRFYVPVLRRAVRYDRVAGYFMSSAFATAAAGLARFIANDGTVRLLVGARLSPADCEALQGRARLEETLERRLLAGDELGGDVVARHRLEVIAWLVRRGRLSIRVGLPCDRHGNLLPAESSEAQRYFHPKWGVLADAAGDRVAFGGSINESAAGWQGNFERFTVYCSWKPSTWDDYGQPHADDFERLWRGDQVGSRDVGGGWRSVPLPEAAEARLLDLLADDDYTPAARDPLEPPPAPEPSPADRELVERIRAAPATRSGVGLASPGVAPWPHQLAIARRIVDDWPRSYLLADEVGLGKTIEAALALRELLLSDRIRTALLLVPASLLVQWQEELAEKFLLEVPYLQGSRLVHPDGAAAPAGRGPERWRAAPVLLASSHLARRRAERRHLLDGPGWDLVFCDEAHHARRRGAGSDGSANNLMRLLADLRDQQMCQAMLLASATPLQMDTADLWGLLDLFGLPPGWRDGPHTVERYFNELREPSFAARDWNLLRAMLAAAVNSDGANPDAWSELTERLGEMSPTLARLESFAEMGMPAAARASIALDERPAWDEWLRANTPVRRRVFRTTRATLRAYQRQGLLAAGTVIPNRKVRDEFLDLGAAAPLYRRIDDYIARHYNAYLAAGGASVPHGFIMTVYRRRLTSSFRAVRCSLARRRDALDAGQGAAALLDTDDRHTLEGQSALDDLPTEGDGTLDGAPAGGGVERQAEIDELDDFIAALDELPPDEPKMRRLTELIGEAFTDGHRTVVVFTQYTDTLRYLRERLLAVYGTQVACYFAGGGERWRPAAGAWEPLSKEQTKELFRQGTEVRILLGTDSMSEGLNLQTCGRLINFDLPWNFMRTEQRIGWVDRIGGRPEVHVTNLFYRGTVEDDIYRRIGESHDWFSHVVGNAAPVLAATESVIQKAAMRRSAKPEDADAAVADAVTELGGIIDRLSDAPVRLEDLDAVPRHATDLQPAMTLDQLGEALRGSDALQHRFEPHPEVPEAWLVEIGGEHHAVTFNATTYQNSPALHLLTWGSPLLNDLLNEITEPAPSPGQSA